MAIDETNLNGSVNIGDPIAGNRNTWNSYNFINTALFQRTLLLNGGDESATVRWWKTPLPYPPFNVRAPEELLIEDNWKSLRDWIGDNIMGGWIDDVDFYNECQRYREMGRQDENLIELVNATTGASTETQSRDGDYIMHRFTSSDYLTVHHGGVVEYLLVGGGGAGGGGYSGGGGGGGTVITGFKRLNPGTYDIVIGAGGAGGWDNGDGDIDSGVRDSQDGNDTTAFGLVAMGGGAGAGQTTNTFAALAKVKGAIVAPFVIDNSVGIGTGGGGGSINVTPGISSSHIKGSNGYGYKGGTAYYQTGIATPIYIGGGGGGAGGPGGDAEFFTLTGVTCVDTAGRFQCDSNPNLLAYGGDQMVCVISGTNNGTATITSYSDPEQYQLQQQSDGYFTLVSWNTAGSPATVVTTPGTCTDLTFTVTTMRAGVGGLGIYSDISDSGLTYGGGGAGGAHGILNRGNIGKDGGASSKDSNLAQSSTNNASANRGGGGAGASGLIGSTSAVGGNGGSGVVWIRYPKSANFGKKRPINQQMNNQPLS